MVWRREVGPAYSGMAVAGGRLFTGESDGSSDFVVALEAGSGREVWRHRLGPVYKGHGGSDDGPTSTPTVAGGRVFMVGPHGVLVALDAASGDLVWRRDLVAEYGAQAPTWSFSTAPLAWGRLLIVQVGGRSPYNLMAFDQASGDVVWTRDADTRLGYSSPLLAELGGVEQVVVAGDTRIYAVRPADGSPTWSHAVPKADRSMVMPLPSDRLFVATWDEGLILAVERDGGTFRAREMLTTPLLKGTYSPTVPHDGRLYSLNGSFITCLDPGSGEACWRERAFEGSLIRAGADLVVWGDGELRVVAADPSAYRERFAAKLAEPTGWTVVAPAYAGGLLYLRQPGELLAVRLTAG